VLAIAAPATRAAAGSGCGQPGAGLLPDQVALELGQGGDGVDQVPRGDRPSWSSFHTASVSPGAADPGPNPAPIKEAGLLVAELALGEPEGDRKSLTL